MSKIDSKSEYILPRSTKSEKSKSAKKHRHLQDRHL